MKNGVDILKNKHLKSGYGTIKEVSGTQLASDDKKEKNK